MIKLTKALAQLLKSSEKILSKRFKSLYVNCSTHLIIVKLIFSAQSARLIAECFASSMRYSYSCNVQNINTFIEKVCSILA